MCIRDSINGTDGMLGMLCLAIVDLRHLLRVADLTTAMSVEGPVSYTHLRAHETVLDLVCRLLLEKKKKNKKQSNTQTKIHNEPLRRNIAKTTQEE